MEASERILNIDWHARFTLQAKWTVSLRQYLFGLAELEKARRILEIGCGTGAILVDFEASARRLLCGLDIQADHLHQAVIHSPYCKFVQGDALRLPYGEDIFDITFCHFLLLWVEDPQQAILEMVRVTRSGGTVMALAEPDYGGRVDYPDELNQTGQWQSAALQAQGADPRIGRRLAGLFAQASLNNIQFGVLGGQWQLIFNAEEWNSERKVLENDLASLPQPPDSSQVEALLRLDERCRRQGIRVLFVPTFYAWGKK